MTAFDGAIDAMFRDRNIALDAVWRQAGGDPKPVRVIIVRPQEEAGYGDSRFKLPAVLIDVRLSEVAAPAKGDAVEVGGVTYTILGTVKRDSSGYVQTCSARAPA